MGRICEEEGGVHGGNGDGDETGTDVSLGDWSGLRCRVEEGFSRMSKVLEDGTIQVRIVRYMHFVCTKQRIGLRP